MDLAVLAASLTHEQITELIARHYLECSRKVLLESGMPTTKRSIISNARDYIHEAGAEDAVNLYEALAQDYAGKNKLDIVPVQVLLLPNDSIDRVLDVMNEECSALREVIRDVNPDNANAQEMQTILDENNAIVSEIINQAITTRS